MVSVPSSLPNNFAERSSVCPEPASTSPSDEIEIILHRSLPIYILCRVFENGRR